MIRFLLDGVVVTNPNGWEDLTSKIRRVDEINALLIFQEMNLVFTADGYDYLYSKLQESFCNTVDIVVQQECSDGQYETIIEGTIFLSGVKFNERACTADAKIEDKSFYAGINNNKNVKTSPFADRTKNGLPLAQAPKYELDVVAITNGTTVLKTDCPAVRVYDALEYLIKFMTDGKVGFKSNTFDIGGDWEGLCVTTGINLRDPANTAFFEQFSFQDLLTELKARIPIGIVLLDPYTNPVLQIENESDLYGSQPLAVFSDIYEVVTGVDERKLYVRIEAGSDVTDDTLTLLFPEDIDFFGFKQEEYFIQGECNIDTALNLRNKWVISSNIIERTVGGDQGADKRLFLIDSIPSSATAGTITADDFLGVGRYYYNKRLTNNEAIQRYIGFVPNSIASYLAQEGEGTFHAFLGANITHTATVVPDNDDYNPLAMASEVFDQSNAYNTATYRFTAPEAGVYTFQSNVRIVSTTGVAAGWADFQVWLRVFDSTNTLQPVGFQFNNVIYGIPMFTQTGAPNGIPTRVIGTNSTVDLGATKQVVLRAGDYVELRVSKTGSVGDISYTIPAGQNLTYLKCLDNSIGGGILQTGDPSLYPVLTHNFTYPIGRDTFQSFIGQSTGTIAFAMNGQPYRQGWIKEISYNHVTGTAEFQLISSQNAS